MGRTGSALRTGCPWCPEAAHCCCPNHGEREPQSFQRGLPPCRYLDVNALRSVSLALWFSSDLQNCRMSGKPLTLWESVRAGVGSNTLLYRLEGKAEQPCPGRDGNLRNCMDLSREYKDSPGALPLERM